MEWKRPNFNSKTYVVVYWIDKFTFKVARPILQSQNEIVHINQEVKSYTNVI